MSKVQKGWRLSPALVEAIEVERARASAACGAQVAEVAIVESLLRLGLEARRQQRAERRGEKR